MGFWHGNDDGEYKVLEASLVIEGRALPLHCHAVHKDEYGGRQMTSELTMWYALCAMRRDGQTLVVVADRGFTKFAWPGRCHDYPWLHLVMRLKANTILTWDNLSALLRDGPLRAGETVQIERAHSGVEQQGIRGVCPANLGESVGLSLSLACAASGRSRGHERVQETRLGRAASSETSKVGFSDATSGWPPPPESNGCGSCGLEVIAEDYAGNHALGPSTQLRLTVVAA